MSITSITLHSCNIRYMPPASDLEEVDQVLTLTAEGEVSFRAKDFRHYYRFNASEPEVFCREIQTSISPWKAACLLDLLDKAWEPPMVTDCGRFTLEIRYEEGPARHLMGPMLEDVRALSYGGALVALTPLLQRAIPIPGLLGFDADLTTDYAGRKAVKAFAKKWAARLRGEELTAEGFYSAFGDDCVELGFQMRPWENWVLEYPELDGADTAAFRGWAGAAEDPDLLGSLAFSAWCRMSHGLDGRTLDRETRDWYGTVLERLEEVTER